MDYLERDPQSEARLPVQQPPTVLAVDVTSDAPDLELLKASLSQVYCQTCFACYRILLGANSLSKTLYG